MNRRAWARLDLICLEVGRRGGERVSGKWAGLGFEISPQNFFDLEVLTSYRGFRMFIDLKQFSTKKEKVKSQLFIYSIFLFTLIRGRRLIV